jgi:hypothetical protein
MKTLQSEALVTVGSIGALVSAALVLARSFGVPINDDQQNALLGFVAVIAPFLVGIIGRQFVYAQDTTQDLVNSAAVSGDPTIGPPPTGN